MLEGKKNEGLSSAQVQDRIKEGLVNGNFTVKTKENFTKRGETQNETKEDFGQLKNETRP